MTWNKLRFPLQPLIVIILGRLRLHFQGISGHDRVSDFPGSAQTLAVDGMGASHETTSPVGAFLH